MAYIELTDITDAVVTSFTESELTPYLDKVDNRINDIAERLRVDVNAIKTPLSYTVKEFAIAYFCMMVCRDKTGHASVEYIQDDKYFKKYEMFKEEASRLENTITHEVLTGTVDEASDRAGGTVRFYRG